MAPRRTTRAPKRAIKRVKYSNETFSNAITVTAPASSGDLCNHYWIPVITPSQVAGMRKAKNFTVNITCIPPVLEGIGQIPIIMSALLVYVPEGTSPSEPNYSALSEPAEYPVPATLTAVYKPDQNIIMSKIGNITSTGTITMRNRLARNLNSGDAVGVILSVFKTQYADAATLAAVVSANYAVTY